MHTRTCIQKNIQIFGADELETYVSPQNWKPKQSCLSAGFYVLRLAKKSMVNIRYWKNEVLLQGCPYKCPFFSSAVTWMEPTSDQADGETALFVQLDDGPKSVWKSR